MPAFRDERWLCKVLSYLPHEPCGVTLRLLAEDILGSDKPTATVHIRAAILAMPEVLGIRTCKQRVSPSSLAEEYWIAPADAAEARKLAAIVVDAELAREQ